MARLPRLYRVRSAHRDGSVDRRHYQTPEAAEERAERFREADPDAIVTVTPSHVVTYPHEHGDAALLEIPDTAMPLAAWQIMAASLGVEPEAIESIHVSGDTLTVEYHRDPSKRGRAPQLWRVYLDPQ